MERDFLTEEQSANLVKFAKILAVRGKMRRFTDDAWILKQMGFSGVEEPPPNPALKHNVLMFSTDKWSFMVVRHCNPLEQEGNGLCCLRIDRKYLQDEFAPKGRPDRERMTKIVHGMLCILNVSPLEVDLDKLTTFNAKLN